MIRSVLAANFCYLDSASGQEEIAFEIQILLDLETLSVERIIRESLVVGFLW